MFRIFSLAVDQSYIWFEYQTTHAIRIYTMSYYCRQVDSSVSNLDHQLQECSLKLIQARGDSKVLQVTVGRVFTVVVVLRSSMIEKFLVSILS